MLSTKAFEQWLQEQAQIAVRYRNVEKSNLLAEYIALKEVVESVEFQAKKNKLTTTRYADTQEGSTMALYKQLSWNTSVVLYNLLKKEAWKEKIENGNISTKDTQHLVNVIYGTEKELKSPQQEDPEHKEFREELQQYVYTPEQAAKNTAVREQKEIQELNKSLEEVQNT